MIIFLVFQNERLTFFTGTKSPEVLFYCLFWQISRPFKHVRKNCLAGGIFDSSFSKNGQLNSHHSRLTTFCAKLHTNWKQLGGSLPSIYTSRVLSLRNPKQFFNCQPHNPGKGAHHSGIITSQRTTTTHTHGVYFPDFSVWFHIIMGREDYKEKEKCYIHCRSMVLWARAARPVCGIKFFKEPQRDLRRRS